MVHLYEKVSNTLLGLAVLAVLTTAIICVLIFISLADKFIAGLIKETLSEVWMFFKIVSGLVLALLFAHSTGKSLKEIRNMRREIRQLEEYIQKEENAT